MKEERNAFQRRMVMRAIVQPRDRENIIKLAIAHKDYYLAAYIKKMGQAK